MEDSARVDGREAHGRGGRGAGPLLRIEAVAERLSVSRSMAWKLIDSGALRSVRIGRAVRGRPADLEAYLADPARER